MFAITSSFSVLSIVFSCSCFFFIVDSYNCFLFFNSCKLPFCSNEVFDEMTLSAFSLDLDSFWSSTSAFKAKSSSRLCLADSFMVALTLLCNTLFSNFTDFNSFFNCFIISSFDKSVFFVPWFDFESVAIFFFVTFFLFGKCIYDVL